jgi:cytoskeletal protein CcmA (bactofilin family)
MFGRSNGSKADVTEAPSSDSPESSPRPKNHSPRGGTIITDQVELKGSLAFDGNLEFNGTFEGEIISTGNLWIGPDAVLKGDVQAAKVVLHGKMHGNITATESVEVCDQAQLYGDVRAGKFIVSEGAIFRGRSEPLEGKAPSPDFLPTFRHLIPKLA